MGTEWYFNVTFHDSEDNIIRVDQISSYKLRESMAIDDIPKETARIEIMFDADETY